MTPRPLYRWKSLWLGILVLAFLGWAWVRSMTHVDGFNWIRKGIIISAGHAYGGVDFSWDPSRAPSPYGMFQWVHEHNPGWVVPWFPKALNWEHYEPGIIQIGIAYWLIILVFLLPWSTWLFLHGKRERKKAAAQGSST